MQQLPFCPNPLCVYHKDAPNDWWFRFHGYYSTKIFGRIPRFLCTGCRKSFSSQTFSIEYYVKKRVPLRDLFLRHAEAQSCRAISRALHISPGTVQNRLDRLARQSLAIHAKLRSRAIAKEDICVDGFVSFDHSQYFPSEITLSTTSRSQFVLELSHASRKRSGIMRPAQIEKAVSLYAATNFERGAVSRTFRDILDTLAALRPPEINSPLVLITDEKPEYQRILFRHPLFLRQDPDHRIAHVRIWSKIPRTFSNPLFASNYIDRQLRKDQANHHRETVCFNRNVANGLSRFACYLAYHNYFKRFRINAGIADQRTHGEVAGISRNAIQNETKALFINRAFLSKTELSPPMERIWRKRSPTPMKSKADYLPAFALA